MDEAHHAVAKTYRSVFDHFGLFSPGTRRMLIGFIATPRLGDGRGLGDVFEEIGYAKDLEDMIRERYLCQVSGWRVRTDVELESVRVRNGDFAENDLAHAVNTPERNDRLLKTCHETAADRRCIVFCANVAHAQAVAKRFQEAGHRAACIVGEMPDEDRKQFLRQFQEGRLDVLTNVNVLTEGYDEPSIDCVLLARPIKSLSLYAQMVGRGTRCHQGKHNLLVIGIVDNSVKHKLAGLHALFGHPAGLDMKGQDALKAMESIRQIERDHPYVDLQKVQDARALPFVLERVNLFRDQPPKEIAELSEFTWLPMASGGYRLGLPQGQELSILANLLYRFELRVRIPVKSRGSLRRKQTSRRPSSRLMSSCAGANASPYRSSTAKPLGGAGPLHRSSSGICATCGSLVPKVLRGAKLP